MSSAGSSELMFVNQLGQLQEYRENLKRAVRSLNQDLRSFDSLLWDYSSSAPASAPASASIAGAEEWAAFCFSLPEPNLFAPSLHLPYVQASPYFDSIQDDLWDYVASIARKTSNALRHNLWRCTSALRRVSEVILILRKVAFSRISFFCSVRWERRRWFLRHGAHPPKQTVQAILSLFTEACSRSLIAYC